ncbi:ChaB family protein [Candidatus Woesearchaeota archaeon]|nr:ChaB family protein [Candidatus Woesearchaeota archaeon]
MPYSKNSELPEQVKGNLPKHAQDIFRKTFNSAWDQYDNEQTAMRVAWAAVKKKYKKEGDQWVRR